VMSFEIGFSLSSKEWGTGGACFAHPIGALQNIKTNRC